MYAWHLPSPSSRLIRQEEGGGTPLWDVGSCIANTISLTFTGATYAIPLYVLSYSTTVSCTVALCTAAAPALTASFPIYLWFVGLRHCYRTRTLLPALWHHTAWPLAPPSAHHTQPPLIGDKYQDGEPVWTTLPTCHLPATTTRTYLMHLHTPPRAAHLPPPTPPPPPPPRQRTGFLHYALRC